MPPRLPPITAAHCRMPRRSASLACASTQSSTVTSGKSAPHGVPVAGFGDSGPVEPKQLPRLLTPTTKKRSVSSGLPGAHHVVPPADVFRVALVEPGDMVRRIERVTDEHRIRAVRIPGAVRLVGELVLRQFPAAREGERRVEAGEPGDDRPDRAAGHGSGGGTARRRGKGWHRETRRKKNRPACSLTGSVSGSPLAAPL